ncbi:hypothetical protein JIY74_32690 [Vibrio harveyi]|nr:hypothetical protein [Vibrio harveyi]
MSQTAKQSATAFNYKEIKSFDELLNEVKKYIKDQKELDLIKEAYDFSYQAHIEQKRKNGDPYIYHPLSAAYYLSQ